MAGSLFMDVKSAFNNVSKELLGKRMEVEQAVPGVSGLSFVDDIGWWAAGKDEEEVAARLSAAAGASMDWAAQNGVTFDQGKTEAAIFWRSKAVPTAMVKVGATLVLFNKEATRWLGVWLDSQLTLKEHHARRLKGGRNAKTRLRRLTGPLRLSPVNCWKVMTACVQSVAMFGAELWWKGDGTRGTVGRAKDLQLLVNRQARASTGCFRTTNLGALSMESGLQAATTQLENRQRRFGLRLLSLPQGDQAKGIARAPTEMGRRLTSTLTYAGRTESTVLLEEAETLDAELVQEEEAKAKAEAEKDRPGLTMFTDRSRLDSGAVGYAVAWKNGQTWKGIKTHMGYNQAAYDAECAALGRALESALRRNTILERITIFTDAQAAIRRMASEEPGPGQQYALQARKHIASLRRARPAITIEIRWCPAHKEIARNEKADEWAKIAAEEPDTRGVEWLNYSDRMEVRPMPLRRSLMNLKREISEEKWAEAWQWAKGQTSKRKYRMPESHRPDSVVAESTKRLVSRVYQLKTGHARTGQYLHWTRSRPSAECWWCQCPTQTRDHLFKLCPKRKQQQKILWAEVGKATEKWKSRWNT